MNSAKAWVALLALIVTGVTSSDIVPVTGTWHVVWVVVVIVIGALATYGVPPGPGLRTPKVIDGEIR